MSATTARDPEAGRVGVCRAAAQRGRAEDTLHEWEAEASVTNPGLTFRCCARCEEEQAWCDACGAALDVSEQEKEAESDAQARYCVDCGGVWRVHDKAYHRDEDFDPEEDEE